MKTLKLIITLVLCTLFMFPTSIYAAEPTAIDSTEIVLSHDGDENFVELTKEEFIEHISRNNNISIQQAEQEVNQKDQITIQQRATIGEIQPRALQLRYGYFESIFYTPTESYGKIPEFSTCATFGVYVSYFLPDASTTWASRRFNAVHDTYLYATNDWTKVIVHSKAANITGPYSIKFASKFDMKRDLPFMYYVNYTLSHDFYL